MKFEIKRHKNGFVIKTTDEDEGVVYLDEEKVDNEPEAWRTFLYTLLEHYGPDCNRSRYSPARIEIRIIPGDKWEPPKGRKSSEYYCDSCHQFRDLRDITETKS